MLPWTDKPQRRFSYLLQDEWKHREPAEVFKRQLRISERIKIVQPRRIQVVGHGTRFLYTHSQGHLCFVEDATIHVFSTNDEECREFKLPGGLNLTNSCLELLHYSDSILTVLQIDESSMECTLWTVQHCPSLGNSWWPARVSVLHDSPVVRNTNDYLFCLLPGAQEVSVRVFSLSDPAIPHFSQSLGTFTIGDMGRTSCCFVHGQNFYYISRIFDVRERNTIFYHGVRIFIDDNHVRSETLHLDEVDCGQDRPVFAELSIRASPEQGEFTLFDIVYLPNPQTEWRCFSQTMPLTTDRRSTLQERKGYSPYFPETASASVFDHMSWTVSRIVTDRSGRSLLCAIPMNESAPFKMATCTELSLNRFATVVSCANKIVYTELSVDNSHGEHSSSTQPKKYYLIEF